MLHIKQCIGILGGRPSHAVWIVGVIEDSEDMLLCLDPHVTQPASIGDHLDLADDLTHHCREPIRMPLQRLDPSLVLGFVCPTEADFDALYSSLENEVLSGTERRYALFELHRTRPSNLPPIPSRSSTGAGCSRWPIVEDDMTESRSLESDRPLLILMHERRGSGDGLVGNNVSSAMNTPEPDDNRLGAAVNAVRDIWSKCNRAAEDAVRSLAKFAGQSGTGESS